MVELDNKQESWNIGSSDNSLPESWWQSIKKTKEEAIVWKTTSEGLAQQAAWVKADNLKGEVVEKTKDHEKVESFIRESCIEPIKWVDNVVGFNDLVQLLIKSAEDENLPEVKKSIEDWNAKDKRIYELSAYRKLIRKWFILPSDIRPYYDSANKEHVYHLWVDYNVEAWKKVKAIYDGKVVEASLDGWLWYKIILEHEMSDWTKFYSLYGHLGSKSLPKVWDKVRKWEKIWRVWEAFTEENGNRNEHLHFQIMENRDSSVWYSKNLWEWNYDVLRSFGKEAVLNQWWSIDG